MCTHRVEACERCGEDVTVSHRVQHEQVCPLAPVECPFKEAGCPASSVPRKDAAAHARAAAETHAALALAAQREGKEQAVLAQNKALAAARTLRRRVKTAEDNCKSPVVLETWPIETVVHAMAKGDRTTFHHNTVVRQTASPDVGLDLKTTCTPSTLYFTAITNPLGTVASIRLHDTRDTACNAAPFSRRPGSSRGTSTQSISLTELRKSYLTANGSMTLKITLLPDALRVLCLKLILSVLCLFCMSVVKRNERQLQ